MEEDSIHSLEHLQRQLEFVESYMKQITDRPLEDWLEGKTPLQIAKMKTVFAYAIATLERCYYKTQGINPNETQNIKHLERIKTYFQKIDRLESTED